MTSLTLAPDGDRLLVGDGYGWTFLRDRDGSRRLLERELDEHCEWHPDSRRFIGKYRGAFRSYDVAARCRLGTLYPVISGNHWLCIGPTGHYRGSPGVEEHIVCVAQLDDGSNITLTPSDFASRFGWKNDPEKATLLKLDAASQDTK